MKIGIIGAMEVEIYALKNNLKDLKESIYHGFDFYEGSIAGHQVIVLLSGVGKVSATIGTTLMIEKFHPDLIINTGTAGGLGNSNVHNLILATGVSHHDVDLTAFGYEKGQCSKMPAVFPTNEKWTAKAREVAEKHNKEVHSGLVVSGDSFISQAEKLKQIETDFPLALAVEMEAAAIAQTCYMMKVPFIMLRAISDKAGEGNTISFDTFVKEAGNLSAQFNIDFISSIQ